MRLIIQVPCLNESETLAVALGALPREVPGFDVVEWLVTEISDPALRAISSDRLRMPEYKSGWLLFQSDATKKRLAPYPDDWRSFSPTDLEKLCARAKPATSVLRPSLTGEFPRFIPTKPEP